ncbi:MAG: efflux RND transporter periplasmic adaptor subunit [Fusobacterium sp.]
MKKLLGIFIITITFVACSSKNQKEVIRPVQVFKIIENENYIIRTYPANTIPANKTNLSFKISGPIEKINVEVGSFVNKDDILAKMDKRDYILNLKSFENKSLATKNVYEASLAISENTESQFLRIKKLYESKTIPKKIYEEALAQKKSASSSSLAALANYQASKQAVENCKNHIIDSNLKAPFSGYITNKFLGEGAVASPGIPVVALASNTDNKVRINLSEEDLNELSNLEKSIFIYNSKNYPLTIETASKIKGFGNISYPATFISKNKTLSLPSNVNGSVKLYIKKKNLNGTAIPIESIFDKDNKTNVWIYENGIVNLKEINVIEPLNSHLVLVNGLKINDQIITKGIHQLSKNEKVKILKTFSKTNIGEML